MFTFYGQEWEMFSSTLFCLFISVGRITQKRQMNFQETFLIDRHWGKWQSITFWSNLDLWLGMFFTNNCSTNTLCQHSPVDFINPSWLHGNVYLILKYFSFVWRWDNIYFTHSWCRYPIKLQQSQVVSPVWHGTHCFALPKPSVFVMPSVAPTITRARTTTANHRPAVIHCTSFTCITHQSQVSW